MLCLDVHFRFTLKLENVKDGFERGQPGGKETRQVAAALLQVRGDSFLVLLSGQ